MDLEGHGLQPRLLGVRGVQDLDRVVVALGPARIHAQEHLSEVGGIHSPGTRADRDHGVALVVLAAEQRADLQLGQVLGYGLQVRLGLRQELGGVLALLLGGHLHHGLQVVDAPAQVLHTL